jgi:hypothetical protein
VKTKITVEIDTAELRYLTERALANSWHIAQANPAPMENQEAGDLVEAIGREIVRRWLSKVEPELWHHQGRDHYWHILQQHGKWLPVNGDEHNRQWTPLKDGGKEAR